MLSFIFTEKDEKGPAWLKQGGELYYCSLTKVRLSHTVQFPLETLENFLDSQRLQHA